MSNLDRSMHRSLWVEVAHSSFLEGSHMTKNTASGMIKIDFYGVSLKINVILSSTFLKITTTECHEKNTVGLLQSLSKERCLILIVVLIFKVSLL